MSHLEKPILILGAGSWGTALALHLSRLNQTVYLWGHGKNHIDEMIKDNVNKNYLPDQLFPSTLIPIADIMQAIQTCDDILIAVPSSGFRNLLISLKPQLKTSSRLIWVTKGLDEKTGSLLHETFSD